MKVYGIVRFTKDLKLEKAGDTPILKTSVAWNDKKRNGHFHNIVLWDKNAENVARFFNKGDKFFIKSGELSNNNYQGKEGMVYQNIITVFEWEFVEQADKTAQPKSYQAPIEYPESTREQKDYDPNNTDGLPF